VLRVETIAIGDELLTGRTSDTNSTYVAAQLFAHGARLERTQTVLDQPADILGALQTAAHDADFVVCFGGLGPTSDDRTAEVVAGFLKTQLVEDPLSLGRLEEYVRKRKRVMTEALLKQVRFPEGTQALPNLVGLAPGFACSVGKARCFFLPGVPSEMKALFSASVLPEVVEALAARGLPRLFSHTWKCVGIPESELQRRMDAVEAALPAEAWLGYRTRYPENHLTLYWKAASDPGAARGKVLKAISALIHEVCYTEADAEIENLVLDRLRSAHQSLALAESCTGGLVAQRLSKVGGSSEAFWGSAVVYQIEAKQKLLGVKLADPLEAVSADCSRRLAESLKKKSGAAVAAAVTGYSGPGGGTDADPVGTFYLHILSDQGTVAKRVSHPGLNREANQWGAATYLLCEIYALLGK